MLFGAIIGSAWTGIRLARATQAPMQLLIVTMDTVGAACKETCDPRPVQSWNAEQTNDHVTAKCDCVEFNIGVWKPKLLKRNPLPTLTAKAVAP